MFRNLLARAVGIGTVVVQYGCIAHCTLEYVTDIVICSGPSMLPTINPGDIIITNHITVNRGLIQKGDIVIARSPTNPRQQICKRVTGVQGDLVIDPPPHFSYKYVPRGHVWLQGDNTDNSSDSRDYGPVPIALIRSRVIYKVWPIPDMESLKSKERMRKSKSTLN